MQVDSKPPLAALRFRYLIWPLLSSGTASRHTKYPSPSSEGEVPERSGGDGGVLGRRRSRLAAKRAPLRKRPTRHPHLASPSEEREEKRRGRARPFAAETRKAEALPTNQNAAPADRRESRGPESTRWAVPVALVPGSSLRSVRGGKGHYADKRIRADATERVQVCSPPQPVSPGRRHIRERTCRHRLSGATRCAETGRQARRTPPFPGRKIDRL